MNPVTAGGGDPARAVTGGASAETDSRTARTSGSSTAVLSRNSQNQALDPGKSGKKMGNKVEQVGKRLNGWDVWKCWLGKGGCKSSS